MATPRYRNPRLPVEERCADLLGRMTLKEKIGQLMMHDARPDDLSFVQERQPGSVLHILGEKLDQAMVLASRTRLGIPLLVGEDCIHGHSFWKGATIFPTQLALSSSWSPELLEKVARVTAREASATGIHWTFSPVLCLTRDLRWGRVGETFGEDPHLIGELGVAMIRGYQGRGLDDPEGLLATAKHYAGYSETQGGRDASEADLSRRKLLSYFLPPFEKAARQGAMTFMTGYQAIDGLPSTINRWLLREVLKNEWGFKGVLVTDWDNVGRLVYEQCVCPDYVSAAIAALRAGNDISMTTPRFLEGALEAVQSGRLREEEVDDPCRRFLELKFRMGLFENPRRPSPERAAAAIATAEHKSINLEAARKSLILLQNKGVLPLRPEGRPLRLAVLGPNADDDLPQLGDWSLGSPQHPPEAGKHPRACTTTVLDGLRQLAPEGVQVDYAPGCSVVSQDLSGLDAAVSLAAAADVLVAVVGDALAFTGETLSTATLELQGGQLALLEKLGSLGKPLIVVLVNTKPLVLPPAAVAADAIIEAFCPGMEGGRAVAELIYGQLNPSGKLSVSIPRHVGQQPVFYSQVRGQHGDRYADLTQEPLFSFGHGLSYTRFGYDRFLIENPRIKPGETLRFSVEVCNRGELAGDEIVQVYLSDLVTSVTWVNHALKAFARVSLKPGEKRVVDFELPYEELALVDAEGRRVVEPGDFALRVGPSSRLKDLLELRFSVMPRGKQAAKRTKSE